MKNLKDKGGLFTTVFVVLILAALGAVWYSVDDVFYAFTQSDFRSMWAASLFVIAIVFLVVANLRADDERTANLTRQTAMLFALAAILMFVAKNVYESAGNDVSKVGELLAWIIPATWGLPVLIGILFFTVETLDLYYGTDKKFLPNRDESQFVNFAYKGLYRVGILCALVGSAIGTYEVAYAFTGSQFHALLYVGTIELAIGFGTMWTHSTTDKNMFWYLFSITMTIFVLAFSFQVIDSFLKAAGGADQMEKQFGYLARQFVFLPPVIVGGAFFWLHQMNQRKQHEPMVVAPKSMGQFPQRDQQLQRPQAPRQLDLPTGGKEDRVQIPTRIETHSPNGHEPDSFK